MATSQPQSVLTKDIRLAFDRINEFLNQKYNTLRRLPFLNLLTQHIFVVHHITALPHDFGSAWEDITAAEKVADSFMGLYAERLWPDRDKGWDEELREALVGYVLPLFGSEAEIGGEMEQLMEGFLDDGGKIVLPGNAMGGLRGSKSEPALAYAASEKGVVGERSKGNLAVGDEQGGNSADERLVEGFSAMGLEDADHVDFEDSG